MPEQKRCCANCDHACRHELWSYVFYSCKLNVGLAPTFNPGHCCDEWTGTIPTVDLGLSYDIWT